MATTCSKDGLALVDSLNIRNMIASRCSPPRPKPSKSGGVHISTPERFKNLNSCYDIEDMDVHTPLYMDAGSCRVIVSYLFSYILHNLVVFEPGDSYINWQLSDCSALEGCFSRYVSSAFANPLSRLTNDEGLVEVLSDVRTHLMPVRANVNIDRIPIWPPPGAGDTTRMPGLIQTNHTVSGFHSGDDVLPGG